MVRLNLPDHFSYQSLSSGLDQFPYAWGLSSQVMLQRCAAASPGLLRKLQSCLSCQFNPHCFLLLSEYSSGRKEWKL